MFLGIVLGTLTTKFIVDFLFYERKEGKFHLEQVTFENLHKLYSSKLSERALTVMVEKFKGFDWSKIDASKEEEPYIKCLKFLSSKIELDGFLPQVRKILSSTNDKTLVADCLYILRKTQSEYEEAEQFCDSPDLEIRKNALYLCKEIESDYLSDFTSLNIDCILPLSKLVFENLNTLKDPIPFIKFCLELKYKEIVMINFQSMCRLILQNRGEPFKNVQTLSTVFMDIIKNENTERLDVYLRSILKLTMNDKDMCIRFIRSGLVEYLMKGINHIKLKVLVNLSSSPKEFVPKFLTQENINILSAVNDELKITQLVYNCVVSGYNSRNIDFDKLLESLTENEYTLTIRSYIAHRKQ